MCPSTVDREQLPGQQADEEDGERYHEGRLRTSLNKGGGVDTPLTHFIDLCSNSEKIGLTIISSWSKFLLSVERQRRKSHAATRSSKGESSNFKF